MVSGDANKDIQGKLEIKKSKVTKKQLRKVQQDLWLSLVSSSHPMTAEGIDNHFRVDNGYSLEEFSRSLGFRTLDGFLSSKHCSEFIILQIIRDELDSVGQQRYSAISFDDITHITNCISETKLHEEQREQRKKFFKDAKYSTEEYQEQALILRERIVRAANEVMLETKLDDISWQSIQDKYLVMYDQLLNKKHLREGFPTGHPSAVIEMYMADEFEKFIPGGLTGNIYVRFTRPFEEIIKFYDEARKNRDSLNKELKMPGFRTADNGYVDYVRERQKKELYLEKKEQMEKKGSDVEIKDESLVFKPSFPSKEEMRKVKRSVKKFEAKKATMKAEPVKNKDVPIFEDEKKTITIRRKY